MKGLKGVSTGARKQPYQKMEITKKVPQDQTFRIDETGKGKFIERK